MNVLVSGADSGVREPLTGLLERASVQSRVEREGVTSVSVGSEDLATLDSGYLKEQTIMDGRRDDTEGSTVDFPDVPG